MKRDSYIWVEKYAPSKVDECILPQRIKDIFLGYIRKKHFPNLFLYGNSGVGKTTVARLLANQLDMTTLFINGSKESGIDTLRNTVENFASSRGIDGKKKVVILDEADYLNAQSTQPALRGFIDKFQNNCRFIFTCNYKNKILGPLQSRCSTIEFSVKKEEKKELLEYVTKSVANILKNEKVKFNSKTLVKIVCKYYPDMRRLLNELQSLATQHGGIDCEIQSDKNVKYASLFSAMKTKDYGDVREWVCDFLAENDSDKFFSTLYNEIYNYLAPESVPEAVIAIAKYQYYSSFVVNHEINILSCITEIMFNSEYL